MCLSMIWTPGTTFILVHNTLCISTVSAVRPSDNRRTDSPLPCTCSMFYSSNSSPFYSWDRLWIALRLPVYSLILLDRPLQNWGLLLFQKIPVIGICHPIRQKHFTHTPKEIDIGFEVWHGGLCGQGKQRDTMWTSPGDTQSLVSSTLKVSWQLY